MKILISADMEGVTGVVNWDQVTPGHAEYARFRKLMTADVNAAAVGAFETGAAEVLVVDGHEAGANILIEELDARVKLVSGSPAPLSMMEGIDSGIDGVFFVGYHARRGSQNAVLDHTWSATALANLWLNERLTGEDGLNAALAAQYGVPVIMISGDQTACAQAADLLGDVEQAVVKNAVGRFAAACLTPQAAQATISAAAGRAVRRLAGGSIPAAYIVGTPVQIKIEFAAANLADLAALLPGVARQDNCISFTSPDMRAAYNAFRAAVSLATRS